MTTPGAGDLFLGHYRRDVKTSIWRVNGDIAPAQDFEDIPALIASRPEDAIMRKRPGIDVSPTATNEEKLAAAPTRFLEEQLNVKVPAFLRFVRKETDNDYHLILGSAADESATYLTAEVSGLPAEGPDHDTLQQVRDQLVNLIGHDPGTRKYEQPDNLLSVYVTGSLFFDGDHRAGRIGPRGSKPQTVWEIHPVIDLQAR